MSHISEQDLSGFKKLHFVGIGGSGMFPIVQILLTQGHIITGSDNNSGETIEQERSMGITVTIGHDAKNIVDADAVVYSAAIMMDNPELVAAKKRGIPLIERSELLGLLTKRYNNCICVAGTHGKTTTTAMLTCILLGCDMDPSAVIGGKLNLINGSGRAGKSEAIVVEACEYVDTFLHLSPAVALILNVDADHMEYFKTLDNLISSFRKYAALAKKTVVYNGEDENSVKAVMGLSNKLVSFGKKPSNDYSFENTVWSDGTHCTFDLLKHGNVITTLSLNVPGEHNVLNAVAAAATAIEAGADPNLISTGLNLFTGTHRRFEILGTVNGVTIADDYAHHPLEIEVTLKAAKQQGYNQIWAVHQPFTYSRTTLLLDDFAKVLPLADKVVMSAIMGGREVDNHTITTQDLADKIPDSVWFETFEEISDYVLKNAKPGDLVITLGCGDVYKCANMMLK